MTFPVKGKNHHRVRFKRRTIILPEPASPAPSPSSPPGHHSSGAHENHNPQLGFIVGKESTEPSIAETIYTSRPPTSPPRNMTTATSSYPPPSIPSLFTTPPALRDALITESSQIQEETLLECLPFLNGTSASTTYNAHGVPRLDRARHIAFLHKSLRKLPTAYAAADASRPWMFYWALAGLATMGEDVTGYAARLAATVRPLQNAGGGFGGGHGQTSHLAPTYAVLLALAMVGGSEALEVVDRKAMWRWLSELKQRDGGYQMAVGGEEDVRGAYCAAVAISLLDLPLELSRDSPAWSREGDTLLTGLPEWIGRCQSYEGGISERPNDEAHGAYAFCALACLCLLGDPHVMIPKYLDVPRLISWLSARQYAPEGGFSGRTNKLVDGCYSHWVGGCWPLVQACLDGPSLRSAGSARKSVGSLYSREGLIRYILCCCQDQTKRGGLRDKPSHNSDAYHTCYVLAGLSSAQNKWHWDPSMAPVSGTLRSAYQWRAEAVVEADQIYDEGDRVGTVHPVFVVPEGVAERTRAYYESRGWR